MELRDLSIRSAREHIAAKELSAVELCNGALERIAKLNELNAFITLMPESALAKAQALDRAAQQDETLPPLAGTILAIKDIIVRRGVRTTAGSKILYNYISPYTATAVERLEAAGAIIIGKTNCDEFAMGSSNENSAYGVVKNPWDTERVPGGSSGGSAVAVAAGMVMAALGTDTGGSIRQPASLCGVVGMKPTYGRVSRYGLIAFGSSLDQIGPFANSVADVAEIMRMMAGRDAHDATSSQVEVDDYPAALAGDVKGLRVGVPEEYYGEGLDAEVRTSIEAAIQKYVEMGAEIVDISLPHTEYAVPVYYLVATAEASANLARFDGVRYGYRTEEAYTLKEMYSRSREEGFGAEVKRRILIGTYVLSHGYYDAYYIRAQKVRTLIKRDFEECFARGIDAMLTPATPSAAFGIGEKGSDPVEMYLNDIFTVTVNMAGLPGISVPAGLDAQGLPLGLQIIGKALDEQGVLNAALALEERAGFTARAEAWW